jgi:hypothetical protein
MDQPLLHLQQISSKGSRSGCDYALQSAARRGREIEIMQSQRGYLMILSKPEPERARR